MRSTRVPHPEGLFQMRCAAHVDGQRCGARATCSVGGEGYCHEHIEIAAAELERELDLAVREVLTELADLDDDPPAKRVGK